MSVKLVSVLTGPTWLREGTERKTTATPPFPNYRAPMRSVEAGGGSLPVGSTSHTLRNVKWKDRKETTTTGRGRTTEGTTLPRMSQLFSC